MLLYLYTICTHIDVNHTAHRRQSYIIYLLDIVWSRFFNAVIVNSSSLVKVRLCDV